MMLLNVRPTAFLLGFFLLLAVVFPIATSAQQGSGIGLSPSLIEEGADPGDVLTETVEVRNLSDVEQTYYLYTRDIAGVRGAGTPIFAEVDSEKTGYELSEWVTLGVAEMTLAPSESGEVPVTIAVPENATPGSHFGGIFVSLEPPRLRELGASVGYQVANIVSIRISGDVLENAQIRSLATDKFVYGSTDVNFTSRVENKGNTLIRPFGPLEITNMFGKRVATIDFNESQSGVFPNTIRDFNVNWTDNGLGFGRYEAMLSMVYGEQGRAQSTMTASATFWILPMEIIQPALIALGIILVGLYIGIRMYVKRTVRAMSGGRRLVRRRGRGPSTLLLVAIAMLAVTALFLIILLAIFA